MSTPGHRWIGIAFGWIAAYVSLLYHLSPMAAFLSALAAFWGSTAPDWLEVAKAVRRRRYVFGLFAKDTWNRQSLIPHRTITHWALLWIPVFAWSVFSLQSRPAIFHALLFGFSMGALGHLLCDWPNPTGIPLLTPFARSRKSLHLWRSGDRREWMIVGFMWICATLLWLIYPPA